MFTRKNQLIYRIVSLVLLVGIAVSAGVNLLTVAFLALCLSPMLVLLLLSWRYSKKGSNFYNSWRGLPMAGECAVARGLLFLKIPNMKIDYLRPKMIRELDGKSFFVRGSRLQRYEVYLKNEEMAGNLLQKLTAMGARILEKSAVANIQ